MEEVFSFVCALKISNGCEDITLTRSVFKAATVSYVKVTGDPQKFIHFAIMRYLLVSKGFYMPKCLILMSVLIALSGCGNKSSINPSSEALQIGDGEFVTTSFVLPLSENQVSAASSSQPDNLLIRGVVGSLMNIATTAGVGKTKFTMYQPLPALYNERIVSIKVKRMFIYLAPDVLKDAILEADHKESFDYANETRGERQTRLHDQRHARKDEIKSTDKIERDFDFLRRLLIKATSVILPNEEVKEVTSWSPIFPESKVLSSKELRLFRKTFSFNFLDTESNQERVANEFVDEGGGVLLTQYNQQRAKDYVQTHIGKIYVIETKSPVKTHDYFKQKYGMYLTRIHTLNSSVLVEVKKKDLTDNLTDELFREAFGKDGAKLEELTVKSITPCELTTCLDLKTNQDINLISFLKTGNAIKIDTYIDPKKAPGAIQLKGFLEFEIKLRSKL